MKKIIMPVVLCAFYLSVTGAEPGNVRTIHLRQNNAQIHFDSKIYELQHISAEEILPFVNSAIQRYSRNSTIRRVTSSKTSKEALLVSTGCDFLPKVDAIIAALDRPCKIDKNSSPISGTGLTRIAYAPKFRAAGDFSNIINTTLGSQVGSAYINTETNTIFWRDQEAAAKRTLAWVETLDQPLPQAKVRLNYYELRDSDLKDWGFDYLAWKNGPGVNLFNVGYNAGEVIFDQVLNQALPLAFQASWGMGGFFTAPQFDMSFIRCLQQSGNASVAANASLVMVSTPVTTEREYAFLKKIQDKYPAKAPFIYKTSMKPEYQNIRKNTLGRTVQGKSYYEDELGVKHADPPNLEAKIVNPFICTKYVPGVPESVQKKKSKIKNGGIIFDYALHFKNVVERGNTGDELSNSAVFSGATTLAFGQEKILGVYEKENDVEQTLGLPILCRIPVLKYLFSTVTTIKERTYIVVTAEAEMIDLNNNIPHKKDDTSVSTGVHRRIENPFRDKPEK